MRPYLHRFASRTAMLIILVLFSLCLINSSATAGWQIEDVDFADVAGESTSLAFDTSGNPAVSYYYGSLMYAHFNGTSWIIETVDDTADVGYYSSLAFHPTSGYPSIS
ncbi:MAG TPA: hypothetical protein VI387_11980, partial [Candidatus Brocadiales bacterium]|nr:hypothetical protein [Candidatus Brocadiales bacterium]